MERVAMRPEPHAILFGIGPEFQPGSRPRNSHCRGCSQDKCPCHELRSCSADYFGSALSPVWPRTPFRAVEPRIRSRRVAGLERLPSLGPPRGTAPFLPTEPESPLLDSGLKHLSQFVILHSLCI